MFSSDDTFQAALARSGVVRIRTFSNLFSSAKILDSRLRTRGRRLAVISNGAAPAMLACESLETRGFRSPLFDPVTHQAISKALGARQYTGRNPIVLRHVDGLETQYARALEILDKADGFDAVLVIFVPDARNDPLAIAQALVEATPFARPLLACWMGESRVGSARDALADAGIPCFRTPEEATTAFDFLHRYHVSQQQLLQLPNPASRDTRADVDAARALVWQALANGKRLLGPQQTREMMRLFGIEVMPAIRAETLEQALGAARTIGMPVAMKLVSPNLAWKAAVVPTTLNVADESTVTRVFNSARDTLARERPGALFRGVLIERMHTPVDARELRVGIHTDPVFGPVISLGIGGDLTALLQKRLVQLPPLNNFLIDELLADPVLANYLGAFRHKAAVDTQPLRKVLRHLSELACELPAVFALDINPLILSEGHAVAIDVQIVLEKAATNVRYGHLAIHPYPWQWVREVTLRTDRNVTLRPIRPEDAEALQAMVRSQSAESRYLRFLHAINDLSPLMLAQFTKLDYDRAMAFVAEPRLAAGDASNDSSEPARIAGVARYSIDADATSAEFAVTVADDWQGFGLATRLMSLLIEHAREHGLQRLWGDVLKNNSAMHKLMESLGFTGRASREDRELMVFTLHLDADNDAAPADRSA